jgi:Flp pilus assembly protein TadG
VKALKFSGDKTGQTLVEFALIITLLLALLFGITEFGRGWHYSNILENSVRDGARLASEKKKSAFNNPTAIVNYTFKQIAAGIKEATLNGNTFISVSAFSKSSSPPYSAAKTPLSSIAQGDAVMVTVHYNLTPLTEAGNIIPVLRGNKLLTKKATMYYEGN